MTDLKVRAGPPPSTLLLSADPQQAARTARDGPVMPRASTRLRPPPRTPAGQGPDRRRGLYQLQHGDAREDLQERRRGGREPDPVFPPRPEAGAAHERLLRGDGDAAAAVRRRRGGLPERRVHRALRNSQPPARPPARPLARSSAAEVSHSPRRLPLTRGPPLLAFPRLRSGAGQARRRGGFRHV